MKKYIRLVTLVPEKLWNYTKSLNVALEVPLGVSRKLTNAEIYLTKAVSGTTGACGMGKGLADMAESYACQDRVCFTVSTIGVFADTLQLVSNFVVGPNVTSLVTMPVSWGCKTFVWSCKHKTLPWKGGCR